MDNALNLNQKRLIQKNAWKTTEQQISSPHEPLCKGGQKLHEDNSQLGGMKEERKENRGPHC